MGVPDYTLSDTEMITAELEKSLCLNSNIPLTKKVLYNPMKKNYSKHFNGEKWNEELQKYRLFMDSRKN